MAAEPQSGPYQSQHLQPTDETMGGVEPVQTTAMAPSGAYSQEDDMRRPQTSKSADFPMSSGGAFDERYPSPNLGHQQLPTQTSRPPSSMSQTTAGQSYQDRQSEQQGKTTNSVVIKVGMVGDAQIGKTSLMVKYVEGNYDEDYIQTLGRRGL